MSSDNQKTYITRRLTLERNGKSACINEGELSLADCPLIILGDAGMGKTMLTHSIEKAWNVRRISAGSFIRLPVSSFVSKSPLIIDGLDEIRSSSETSAVDDVLKKLGALQYPPFVLSCRAADWSGAINRHKVHEDYGQEPATVQLEPFSREDAEKFLLSRSLPSESILDELDNRDLTDFYKNPLTLTLVAEIVESGQSLPTGRASLFEKAGLLLVVERNVSHQQFTIGKASSTDLLDSAGAIFAHLLISGSLGVANVPAPEAPLGFVPASEVESIERAPLAAAALRTRLFQSYTEGLLEPYHRTVAEYLGGRWLAKQLDHGLSQRRALQTLVFLGGIPTPLRGLYAWLGHFAPRLADTCIQDDPYGALKYGDPGAMSVNSARVLLSSLGKLAEEDPYFRSEDWGRKAVAGLARRELKDEIVAVLTQRVRHVHLSTLILEALQVSDLAEDIVPELTTILVDTDSYYTERFGAGEALIAAGVAIDWPSILRKLTESSDDDSKRLTLELAGELNPQTLPASQVAHALLDYYDVFEDKRERQIGGVAHRLTTKLSSENSVEILDCIDEQARPHRINRHWRMGFEMGAIVFDLIAKAIDSQGSITPERLWNWLSLVEAETGMNEREREKIADFLIEHERLRRDVQRIAMEDPRVDGGPWMAIVSELPQCSSALAISVDDAILVLTELNQKGELSEFDLDLWYSLVRFFYRKEGLDPAIAQVARDAVDRNPKLAAQWTELQQPPKRDWEAEEAQRRAEYEAEQEERFAEHRSSLAPHSADIRSGKHLGALISMAQAYLGLWHELDNDQGTHERLEEWIGDDLAKDGCTGFVAALGGDWVPSVKKIAEASAKNQSPNTVFLLIAGVAELMRTSGTLSSASNEVLQSALAAWSDMRDWYAEKVGLDLHEVLQDAALKNDQMTSDFLDEWISPKLVEDCAHVSGLYQLTRDRRYVKVAGDLALRWLTSFPSMHSQAQSELIQIALQFSPKKEFLALARERFTALKERGGEKLSQWIGALFVADFEESSETLGTTLQNRPEGIWYLRGARRGDQSDRRASLSASQNEFVVRMFGKHWPPASMPSGGSWGDQNAWDASDFLSAAIRSLGADSTRDAAEALVRLSENPELLAYREHLLHMRARQSRLRRDSEYRGLSFSQAKAALAGSLPESIDDLKAVVLDSLSDVQLYLRKGDTTAWKQFWNGDQPITENDCRDRMLDLLRGNLVKAINALPETRMPDEKRVDIGVFYDGLGLPIEIKGQWHDKVWSAPTEQLLELYANDYRADGRGIYVVIWHGPIERKNLSRHPATGVLPKTPAELRNMLTSQLAPAERARIDVVVLDVSKS